MPFVSQKDFDDIVFAAEQGFDYIAASFTRTAEDILEKKHFEDAICTFAYALDIHHSEGGGVTFTTVNGYYTIPYRCMLPENCKNLLVAGRCISGTSEGDAGLHGNGTGGRNSGVVGGEGRYRTGES